jgi:uncharacterized membrane protein
MDNVASKEQIQETVVESLVGSLNQAKQEAAQAQAQASLLGHIVRALVGAISDDGTYALTPEQVEAAANTTVNWQLTPEGGLALTTE